MFRVGLVSKGSMDVVGQDWRSTTNKRVVESFLSAETHSAIMAHGLGRFVQALIIEMRYGSCFLTQVDEDEWQDVPPMNMVTDCRSIDDHVKRDGQHVMDKGSIVQDILLRKMCDTRPFPNRARLWWVPARWQVAHGLTKPKGHLFRSLLGRARFHELSAAKLRGSLAKDNWTSVNV